MSLSTENPSCLFCGSKSEFLYEIKGFQNPFKVNQCLHCGLIFQHPMPDKKQIQNLYHEGYYTGSADFSYEDERKTEKFSNFVWDARIKKLQKSIKTGSQVKNFLDIGCSFGGLLKRAQKAGFNAYGVELSDYSRKTAEDFFKGRIFENFLTAGFQSDFFDAVSLIEVIEHLSNPEAYLKEIYRVLKPGGTVLIQTANLEARQAKKAGAGYHYFLPGHLVYFSKRNLREKLLQLGFKKVKFFHPVEFGLLPKLKKSRGGFNRKSDYLKWFKIAAYHFKSMVYLKDRCLTSSMAVYAWK